VIPEASRFVAAVVVDVPISGLLAISGLLDQALCGGDERVGLPEVVA
jgi:hypothetical protein